MNRSAEYADEKNNQAGVHPHRASFRDPSGFVFTRDGTLYRQVNPSARGDYELLASSGLYDRLVQSGDMVSHEDADPGLSPDGCAYRVIRPELVPFISYPYEWCFSQLKDAALLTLRLQKKAMAHGMSLKDATPYNVAFAKGRAVWIDTLSFEALEPGAPWVAYRQFCEAALAPLALMSQVDVRMIDLLRTDLDGIPLDLASRLLPLGSRLRPGLLMHVHVHATAQKKMRGRVPPPQERRRQMSSSALTALIDNLEATVARLSWKTTTTTWGNYYEETNYTEAAFKHKRSIVAAVVERLAPAVVWDLGANDGTFSRLASERGIYTVAFDADHVAVEKNYLQTVAASETSLLPLRIDLTNPSARCGWADEERDSLEDRGPADLALVLALVHHLAIGHNVPLERIADYLSRLARAIVIEFVPKEDSQVQRMLSSRRDIFDTYTREDFERAFSARFVTEQAISITDSVRAIYVMRRRP